MAEKSTSLTKKPTSEELNKQLKNAIRTIDRKLKSLGVVTAENNPGNLPLYKSGGSFKYNENDGNTINIHTHADIVFLGKALAKMKRVKKEYNETMEGLGLISYPICMWYGQDIDNWIHDLEIRTKVQANHATIQELYKSRQELTQFLSQEDKLENALTKVSALLKS